MGVKNTVQQPVRQRGKMEKSEYPIVAKYRLKERDSDGMFGPLLISNSSHPALIRIVRAFNNSNEVKLGYSTFKKGEGVVEPTMKKKSIYLTGTSARDHLANQSFNFYVLVTDALPDEIRKILKSPLANFKEIKPKVDDFDIVKKYKDLPGDSSSEFYFYASRWDQQGQEIEITAVVKGQKCYISTFCIHEKNRAIMPFKAKFTMEIEKDAATRDITINAMYIKLKDPEGENSELLDPQGGMHDLKAGIVQLIKPAERSFDKNPYLPFALCNVAARFGKNGILSRDLTAEILDFKHSQYDKHVLKRMFVSSIENPNVPVDKYIYNLRISHLLQKMFPRLRLIDMCKKIDCSQVPNNKLIALALILEENSVEEVGEALSELKMADQDIEQIQFLMKLHDLVKSSSKDVDKIKDAFEDTANIPKSVVKKFLSILGAPQAYSHFINDKFV
jgi:hypothetical protein